MDNLKKAKIRALMAQKKITPNVKSEASMKRKGLTENECLDVLALRAWDALDGNPSMTVKDAGAMFGVAFGPEALALADEHGVTAADIIETWEMNGHLETLLTEDILNNVRVANAAALTGTSMLDLLGMSKAAQSVNVSEEALKRMIEAGLIPLYTVGGCIPRVNRNDVKRAFQVVEYLTTKKWAVK